MMSRAGLASLALCLAVAPVAVAQRPGEVSYRDESVMPAGKVGERIRSLIETFNSGDPERVRRFLEEECTEGFRGFVPMEEHLDVFRGLYRQTGGIDFHGIRTYVPERPGETVVILKDRNFGSWRAIVIGFDDSAEQLVSGLSFAPARTPTNVEEPAMSESRLVQTTRTMVERICTNDVFSGAVLLAKGDEVLYSRACGLASKRFGVANNFETKFNLGSMNKMFTATAIVQLVERGELSFDDQISKYVDESWLPREISEKITVHHLLTHTSGLGSYFNDTFWQGSREIYRGLEDFKPLVQTETLAFEPGARYRYSNTGMLLLGVVVESVTGMSYFDFIRENIYEPAGMKYSDSYEMDEPVPNLAMGYIPDGESEYGWRNNLFLHVIKGGPAGGGFSTVGDLHRFARALVTHKLVRPASLRRMWADQSGEGYGYGFGVDEGPAGKIVGHGGGFPGLNGDLAIFVDKGYVVAVLSNYDRAASPLSQRIQALVVQVD